MKSDFFIKYNPIVNQNIGSHKATLILGTLEYWFKKYPDGFYKFIEPCSHNLYSQGESWSEVIGCHRTTFWRSFDLIGKRYKSKWSFEKSEDKFEGKAYASYYDRYTNRTFFIKNNETIKGHAFGTEQIMLGTERAKCSVQNEQNARYRTSKMLGDIYNDSKSTSKITKNMMYDGNEQTYGTEQAPPIAIDTNTFTEQPKQPQQHHEKMIEIWNTIVGNEETKVSLNGNGRRNAYLKQAFASNFDQSIDKWENYCKKIASPSIKHLLGEREKPTIDWALKFEIINKITNEKDNALSKPVSTVTDEGQYFSQTEQNIKLSKDTDAVKFLLTQCLKRFGGPFYRSWFEKLYVSQAGDGSITIQAPSGFHGETLFQRNSTDLQHILGMMDKSVTHLTILYPHKKKDGSMHQEIIERRRL